MHMQSESLYEIAEWYKENKQNKLCAIYATMASQIPYPVRIATPHRMHPGPKLGLLVSRLRADGYAATGRVCAATPTVGPRLGVHVWYLLQERCAHVQADH